MNRILARPHAGHPLTTAASAALAATLATAALLGTSAAFAGSADIARGTLHGHAYQNGGISKEQVADLAHHLNNYNLRLTFSEGKHNAYVTGLKLDIRDAAGKHVFDLADAGPLTDLQLAPGHYRVVADFGGVKRSASVEVKAGEPAAVYLHWPKDET